MKNKILNKMTRKIYMLLLTMSLIVTYNCTETYLDTAPTDSISEVAAFSNPDNIELVINGLHRQMYNSVLNGASGSRNGESHFMPSFDFISGEVIHTGPGFNWMKADAQWLLHTNANSTTVFNFWYQRYHFVATSNAIINNVAASEFTVTPQLNSILGQAHAYRAWAYWRLVTTYSKGYLIGNPSTDPGVPITDGLSLTEGAPRGTVADVYAQIESDIDDAIEYLKDANFDPEFFTLYENKIVSDKGDKYQELYAGVNFFIYQHKLKLQMGLQYAEMRDKVNDGGEYQGWGMTMALRSYW